MAIDNVTLGETIDPDWGNAVADALNDGYLTDSDGTTVYDVRCHIESSGSTDGSGLYSISAATLGLTTIVGAVAVGAYSAIADAPGIQGVNVSGSAITFRYVNMDDGTVRTSSGGITPIFVIAWGTL